MSVTRCCTLCSTNKPETEFTYRKDRNDYNTMCRRCVRLRTKLNPITKLRSMYRDQIKSSKIRGMALPDYTFDDFKAWANKNGFCELHKAWCNSGFRRRDSPSADRLDNTKGYKLDNIQLVTWGINFDNAKKTRSRPVYSYNLNMEKIGYYKSVSEASFVTGAHRSNIVEVCNNKRMSTKGFIFRFKNSGYTGGKLPDGQRVVRKLTIEGELVEVYPSIAAAALGSGSINNRHGITSCCNKADKCIDKIYTSNGFRWEYDTNT